jgi:hypothetical protein
MKDGTLVEWGGGEIQRAMPPLSNVVCISAGFENNLALTSDGRVVSWPQKLPFSLTNIVAIACTHVEWGDNVVIRKDGTIIKWNRGVGSAVSPVGLSNVIAVAAGGRGGEDLALRGDGTVIDLPYNTADWHVHSGLSNVVAIAAGGSQCMALKSDGTVAVWGDRFPYRATVPEGLSNVVAIAAGEDFCLAIQTNSVAPPK